MAGFRPKSALKTTSPVQKVYSGNFAGINGADPTTYKLDPGVTVTRISEGVWDILLPAPLANFKAVCVWATDNDGKQHDVQWTATASTRKIRVTHRVGGFGSASCTITDISTASSAYTLAPCDGVVAKVWGRLGGAISGADSAITTAIAGGAITNGGFTVAYSGSAANDIDSGVPTAANAVTAGQLLTATTNGNSTDAATEEVRFIIEPALQDVVDEIGFIALIEESDCIGAGV